MKFAFRYGLIVLACGVLLTGIVRADEIDAGASDGPSRRELFEARMKAEYGPSVLSAAIARPFIIPSDVLGDAVYGIDVSHHNDENCVCKAGQKCNLCKVDWSRVASQKVSFVYIKTTQGTRFKDPTFDYHWRALAQHKISRGPNHFMAADEDPVEQADHFVDKLQELGKLGPADLPPCLDLESDLRKDAAKKWIIVAETGEKLDFWKGQEPDEIMGKILKWLRRVEERTGRIPIVYTSRGWWRDRIKDDKKFAVLKRYPIWIANYPESGRPANESPKVPNDQSWALWHFSESARMRDAEIIPGNLDANVFKGTLVNFRKTMGMPAPDAQEIARAEEIKDSPQPAQQVASIATSQTSDANSQKAPIDSPAPKVESLQASPSTDGKKPAATNPSPPVDAAKPAPSADADKLVQQAAITNPPSPPQAPTKPAAQPAVTNPPSPPTAAVQVPAPTKPADQTASIVAAEQKGASNPPAPPAPPSPPATSGAGDAAQDSGSSAAKTPPASRPSSSSRPTRASGQKLAAAAEKTPVETAAVDKAAVEKAAAEKVSAEKTAAGKAPGEKVMIEIELLNGRKLRVDANIDPAVLARLIAAIDK